ncbi:MAG: hypothetical protein COS82_04985 [Zetaproteobacteria bacterium CG06_land_8_20_14_3_00_59_53]|nr:MAG: hypothetical protein AUK36_04635 [Zetaproteobacteria bacterium CG2_30_59_37]PIO89301.1 MAG: hypothetical protein COX56_08110 [Zetaproteobacteria bacterium CG23_combo_of_CG06-09_8_20_14_all_59_86]PIQ65371.1 MAG: hypothetical protein COV97_04465 [Zetaproteobacteria bacterium CG11_big_fil_rev_8_21_14_0_20_59_439]PIU70601.1 MAG: hypothetical protein COS82_04985 [Zetaproteobacteria bacterium CG06_land_8_20_14_3_00_59_53]PIU98131.1 MAG: hypothetical protein COS62_00585 [Zetaproteobacteria bac
MTEGTGTPAENNLPDDAQAASGQDAHEVAEIPEHCLRWCFEVLAPAAPEIPPYDLCHPPELAPETLARLKSCIAVIPPLPEIWHKVRAMVESDEASPRDLARLVEQDPVLTSHVLKWGNSAIYAPTGAHASTDVAHTLARMGMDEAQNLILESLLPQIGEVGKKSSLEAQHIWFHSKAISMFCRQLAAFSSHIDAHHGALYGLMHDIGKLIILHLEDDVAQGRIHAHMQDGMPDLQAEWQVLGYTHIDAGMMLALHWHLPREVHRFIYFHHHAGWHTLNEWPQDEHDAVMLVHAAHMLLHGMQQTAPPGGVWEKAVRMRLDESEAVLRHRLHIPLTDTALYAHLQHDIDRLKLLFPELYPPDKD